ncbi:MAG: UDP-N-acetylmuramoyl-L-alanine--D-glutamate ligase [Prevotellaceae bacterium]|jgi:UDP-N-acetylmuramoylalanine--D-glutamate ligase|nr:UDP-N-acetylmuramoyl-L-alanine--D-glutamate ligase [Prevotellaceae bacterium]
MNLIVVLGAGESGAGAAILAKKQGFDVFVSDFGKIKDEYKAMLEKHQIPFEEGQHTEEKIFAASEVIKSPGISDKAPIILKIKERGINIISEIEFAGRFTNAKMICITGSNGKTTTTMLIYHILKNAGVNVGLAGNVGKSLALQVAEAQASPTPPEGGDAKSSQDTVNQNSSPFGKSGGADYYVVELSSFQLDGMTEFKADIAILLNITPDHLDRYDYKFQNYIDSKFRITQNQTEKDAFIFWEDDPVIKAELAKRNIQSELYPFAIGRKEKTKAFIENEELVIKILKSVFKMPEADLAIKGMHNIYNSMAAGLAASIADVKKENIRQSLQDFQGVEHRLEYVATVRNVRFINDSKATNVNSCWYALQSIKSPVALILGGTDKGNDYSEIETLVNEKVRALVFMGVDNAPLHAFFDGKVERIFDARSMKEAVDIAYRQAKSGDTVLLSPCCASFDLFENYEDRGRQFKTEVRKL